MTNAFEYHYKMPLPYHAGKAQLAKPICTIIINLVKKNETVSKYAEPFCGMMRVGLEIMKNIEMKKYLFNDVDKRVTVFLKALQKGWLPTIEEITQQKWGKYKSSKRISAQKSFIGYMLGFGGQYFGGSRPTWVNTLQHRYLQNKRKKLKLLQPFFRSKNLSIQNKSAFDIDYKNTIIYCDPPYIQTGWRAKSKWNADIEKQFWDVVFHWLEPSKKNIVVVSNSYKTPRVKRLKIKILFKKIIKSKQNWTKTGDGKNRAEMLFLVERAKQNE